MKRAEFQVGMLVEITFEEQKILQEAASEMFRLARRGEGKWFYRYVKAHMRAHRVIQIIMGRSHANS